MNRLDAAVSAAQRPAAPLLLAALLPFAATLALTACRSDRAPERVIAQEVALTRQIEGLRQLVAAAERGSLVPSDRVVIAVEEELVRDVAQLALPREEVVGGRYRVRLEKVDVRFRDKWGSVRLDGRVGPAGPAEDGEGDVFADLTVFGLIDAVDVDPASGVLSARVTPIGFEVGKVGMYGESATGRRLLEAFGRTRLEDLASLTVPVRLPVRLEQQISLGGLSEGPVRLHPATVPLKLAVADVSAHGQRLWVSVEVTSGSWVEAAASPRDGGGR